RRKLGRGLGSLISAPVRVDLPGQPDRSIGQPVTPDGSATPASAGYSAPSNELSEMGIRLLALDEIRPNPRQPRQHFDEDALNSLANSIKSSGLMQPIVV